MKACSRFDIFREDSPIWTAPEEVLHFQQKNYWTKRFLERSSAAKASYGTYGGALESSRLPLVGTFNRSKKDSKLAKREPREHDEFFYQQKNVIFVLTITLGFPIEKPPMAAFLGCVGSFSIGNHTVISHFQKKSVNLMMRLTFAFVEF